MEMAGNPTPDSGELPVSRPVIQRSAVSFEYVGASAMMVVGPITGQRYRFSHPGTALEVDLRDAPAMMAVPNLRRVR